MLTLILENETKVVLHNEALECASFDGVRQQLVLNSSSPLTKKFKQYYYSPFITIAIISKFLTIKEISDLMESKIRRIIVEEDNDAKEFLIRLCDIDVKQNCGLLIITIKGRAI